MEEYWWGVAKDGSWYGLQRRLREVEVVCLAELSQLRVDVVRAWMRLSAVGCSLRGRQGAARAGASGTISKDEGHSGNVTKVETARTFTKTYPLSFYRAPSFLRFCKVSTFESFTGV